MKSTTTPDRDVGSTESSAPVGWRSRAEWSPGHIYNKYEGDNTTCDKHDTREQAEAVCGLLRRNGLGGERIIFPVRTWVEPVLPNVKDEPRRL